MKDHRMFSLYVIDSDAFLDMSLSAQAVYFHLCMRADDDGFVNNPKKIQRMIGASDDDLKLLMAKQFVIPFDTGVIVIRHWRVHNTIRKDMYKPTLCQQESEQIETDSTKTYQLRNVYVTDSLRERDGNVPLREDKIREDKISKDNIPPKGGVGENEISQSSLSEPVKEKMIEFLEYRKEIKKPYKSTKSIRSLISQIEKQEQAIGSIAVIHVIDTSMQNGWQGLFWDKAQKPKNTAADMAEIARMMDEGVL